MSYDNLIAFIYPCAKTLSDCHFEIEWVIYICGKEMVHVWGSSKVGMSCNDFSTLCY